MVNRLLLRQSHRFAGATRRGQWESDAVLSRSDNGWASVLYFVLYIVLLKEPSCFVAPFDTISDCLQISECHISFQTRQIKFDVCYGTRSSISVLQVPMIGTHSWKRESTRDNEPSGPNDTRRIITNQKQQNKYPCYRIRDTQSL